MLCFCVVSPHFVSIYKIRRDKGTRLDSRPKFECKALLGIISLPLLSSPPVWESVIGTAKSISRTLQFTCRGMESFWG